MIGVIVVASGYGSCRSIHGTPFPKVLEDIGGRPMIARVLDAVSEAGLSAPVVVTNPVFGLRIQSTLKEAGWSDCLYATQPTRSGACDAVLCGASDVFSQRIEDALVVYADMPLWRPVTIRALVRIHEKQQPTISMVSVPLRNSHPPELERYGRIVRNGAKEILRVVEAQDASTLELRESDTVNPSLWIWNMRWLCSNAFRVPLRAKGDGFHPERYLPPLVGIAHKEGQRISELPLEDPFEALGVNSPQELEKVRAIFLSRSDP